MNKTAPAGTITEAEAAKLIMVDARHVRRLAAGGYIERVAPGRYLTISLVQGYIRWLTEERKSPERLAAENRVQEARARDFEVRTAIRASELMAYDEHVEVTEEIVRELRSATMGLAATVTRNPAMRRKIDDAVDAVFERASSRLKQLNAGLRKSGTALDADMDA